MLILEFKVKATLTQYKAIEEAIRTTQFVRNSCIRYWIVRFFFVGIRESILFQSSFLKVSSRQLVLALGCLL